MGYSITQFIKSPIRFKVSGFGSCHPALDTKLTDKRTMCSKFQALGLF